MADKTRAEVLREIKVEDIQADYRAGDITAATRNRVIRDKARQTVGDLVEDHGPMGALLKLIVKHAQAGWDDMVAGVRGDPKFAGGADVGRILWGQIQMAASPIMALGDVAGQTAENIARRAGASPGLARAIGITSEIGVGPARMGAKAGPKVVRAVAERATEGAAKAAIEPMAQKAIAAGLEAEGIKVAGTVATEAAPKAAATVREKFLVDLEKFHRKMSSITAKQAHEETAKLAERLGLNLEDLRNLVPGQALDEKQMFAYLKALEPQVTQLTDFARRAVADGTEESANALAKFASEFFAVVPTFRGAEVTAGRSVEILKEQPHVSRLTEMLMRWDPESLARGDFAGAMKTFAEDIVAMADQPEKLASLAVAAHGGRWAMLREAYVNLLLPFASIPSFIGNSLAVGNSILERAAGGRGQEALYLAKGMTLAMGDGLKAFGRSFKELPPEEIYRLDYAPGAIPGVIGSIVRSPGTVVRGVDNFFKTILKRGSYYAQAIRDGATYGLEGEKLGEFVARRVQHPTEAMIKEADNFALANTFQNDLGPIASWIKKGAQAGPGYLYWPFMKSPINLVKYSWDRTPGLQLISKKLYDDLAAGGPQADLAMGRLTTSNLMGMYFFEMAKEGYITGSGPADPALRASWLATHQPYSIKTPWGWVPYRNMDPLSAPLGMVADFAQVVDQLDEPTAGQVTSAISFAIARNLGSNSWWGNTENLVEMVQSFSRGEVPNEKIQKALASPATAALTGGPVGTRFESITDPVQREARGFLDQIIARVPGYSPTLPARRDAYGDPITAPEAAGSSWFGVFAPAWPKVKRFETDRVKVEGARLQVRIDPFPWQIGGRVPGDFDIREPQPGDRLGVELNPQQRDRWQEKYREMLRHPELGIEKNLLDQPAYREAPLALQNEMFQGALSDYRGLAKDALMIEDQELGRKLLEAQGRAILPKLQPAERPAASQRIQEGIGLYESLSPAELDNLTRFGDLTPDEPVEVE